MDNSSLLYKNCIFFVYSTTSSMEKHERNLKIKDTQSIYSHNSLAKIRNHCFYYTGYPIERYVGWTVTSSKFIFNISGVIPLVENHFLFMKILPRNLWIDLWCLQKGLTRLMLKIIEYNVSLQLTCLSMGYPVLASDILVPKLFIVS